MRVLFITGEFPPMQGGVGDYTNEIARALAKRGVEVSVLTTVDDSPQSGSGRRKAESGHQTAESERSISIRRAVKEWRWSALSEIRKAIQATRAEIYHIQYQTAAFEMHPMINFAPRLIGNGSVKSSVTFHDLRPMYLFPKAGRARDWVTFQLARSSDAVVATNEEDYGRLNALDLENLSLIPIGSNIDPSPPVGWDRQALRAKLGVGQDEILLCYFGFLNESKGGETLVRALAEIPNAKLVMLGGQTGASDATNAAYLGHVKQVIADLGLTPRVIWTDFLSQGDVSAHLLAADMCVLPYRDGASYRRGTFMAALAHGTAIVTTDDSSQGSSGQKWEGHMPALRDGENVLLVPPDNAKAIAEAIKRTAAAPELRQRLQRGARETAEFFTWDKIARAHFELYDNLMKGGEKP